MFRGFDLVVQRSGQLWGGEYHSLHACEPLFLVFMRFFFEINVTRLLMTAL